MAFAIVNPKAFDQSDTYRRTAAMGYSIGKEVADRTRRRALTEALATEPTKEDVSSSVALDVTERPMDKVAGPIGTSYGTPEQTQALPKFQQPTGKTTHIKKPPKGYLTRNLWDEYERTALEKAGAVGDPELMATIRGQIGAERHKRYMGHLAAAQNLLEAGDGQGAARQLSLAEQYQKDGMWAHFEVGPNGTIMGALRDEDGNPGHTIAVNAQLLNRWGQMMSDPDKFFANEHAADIAAAQSSAEHQQALDLNQAQGAEALRLQEYKDEAAMRRAELGAATDIGVAQLEAETWGGGRGGDKPRLVDAAVSKYANDNFFDLVDAVGDADAKSWMESNASVVKEQFSRNISYLLHKNKAKIGAVIPSQLAQVAWDQTQKDLQHNWQ